MDVRWDRLLADQLEWHWANQARPRLDGLTDDEVRWEPVAGCWSVRPRAEAASPHAAGAGPVVVDFEWPPPEPPPVTTIAWRLAHLTMTFGRRAATHFGGPATDINTVDWPLDAAAMLALVDDAHDRWATGVAALGPDGMVRPCGPGEGPFADDPMAALVLHLNREAIHHLAEIALLRDLHAAS
jgi:DinB superfamily